MADSREAVTSVQDPFTVKNQQWLDFQKELATLINRYSIENDTNCPDYMLAEYVVSNLQLLGCVVMDRDDWYGHRHRPGCSSEHRR